MNKIILIVLTLLIVGCSGRKEKTFSETHLPETVLKEAEQAVFDTISLPENFYEAKEFYVYNDSIALKLNRKHEGVHFLEIFNWKSGRIIKKMLKMGNGHKEVLSLEVYLQQNGKLVAIDYYKKQIAVMDVDSVISDSLYGFPIEKEIPFGISMIMPYQDDYLIENPYRYIDRKADIVQDEPGLLSTEELQKSYEKKYQYNTANVATVGRLLTNEHLGRILHAASSQSILEVYDSTRTLLRVIDGPVNLKPAYYIDKENGNEVIFSKQIPYAYLDGCAGKRYVYLSYLGQFQHADEETLANKDCYILKFDWDGQLIKCLKTPFYILSLSVLSDEKGNDRLFATVQNDQGEPMLLRVYEES